MDGSGILRLAHGRTHHIVKIILATTMVLDSLLGEVVEEVKETSNDKNWCTESESPWSDLLVKFIHIGRIINLRMLSSSKSVSQSKDNSNHGNQGSDLDHSPCGPVQRNKILAIAKL